MIPVPTITRILLASIHGHNFKRKAVEASCDCIMGVQSFVRTPKTQARNLSKSFGAAENLLEYRAGAGFTGRSGEMAEWLKAAVC